ncbi:GINS complex, Psf2 component [Coccomyxa subellipsoidea C-169]|uniref:DNA replication complex GINS protein PSF2 n=1 Tax=Coccomyxa subellipsoidea (strain C-169) TaxID=574566 RepID=I0YTJ3_COCSC|nr:GINS complex, Psf2 component [Coccomyxa subellipsoidea C-169]EIE21712.1 GINS complex, Psf2 component [Coccomyxa subellipsoidea C-169]|eukprot:XP_005646256.1 GINS complex, Psf2 component [Coccomyxa subellipsoidea C-169]
MQLEFFAEDDIVKIVPNFSLPTFSHSSIRCIGGAFGPFKPNIPVEVPIWLAVALQKRNNCRILQPDWLNTETLQEALDQEKNTAAVFHRLPFHYLEISRILFLHAKEAFGSNLLKVKELVGDICKVRLSKINAGLQVLQGPMTVKLNNLSAAECNVIRPFFQGALDRFHLLAAV